MRDPETLLLRAMQHVEREHLKVCEGVGCEDVDYYDTLAILRRSLVWVMMKEKEVGA